ncbi:MAG TPA: transporter substrate-binding domain-containing protein [Anaeromyxobacteraceae bacterium]|nr:transporter substrate-binding domain-containing protein [Anaeromyxobacteraceae bacterium]
MTRSLAAALLLAAATAARAELPAVIVVGGDRDYPPYEFLGPDGKPAGYDVDLTRAIAEVMGMKVEIRLGAWSAQREALAAGRIDALEGLSWSEARARDFDFAPPHTVVHHAIFARRETPAVGSIEALRGHAVVVHRGGYMDDTLTAAGQGGSLLRTDTPADALRLLASGQGEYAVVAAVPGMWLVKDLKLDNLRPVAPRVAAVPYGHAVRKGNAELLARFTEGLAILQKTGRYDRIRERWLGVLEPRGMDWGLFTRYAALVVVPLLLGLVASAVWTRQLQRLVAERTASLAAEVAERQRAVEELRRKQQELLQADKLAALGVLVSGVAHEINNPNGLVLLDVPAVRAAWLDAGEVLDAHRAAEGDFDVGGLPWSRMRGEIPRLLDEMQDGARRIKRIVDDLKDFARRDDAARTEPFDLNAAVAAALRLVDGTTRKATARLEVALAPGLPPARGSAQRIEQVVVNLVLNACQALPGPERGVAVATGWDAARGRLRLTVRDEGVGIPPEHLARLTEPFFTTKRDAGGTGLGLSVSAGIVEEHGGALEFASAPGQGTTVTVWLPAAAAAGAAA